MYTQTKLTLLGIFIFLVVILAFLPVQQRVSATYDSVPQRLSIASIPIEEIVQVAVGGTHTCVVTNGGGVKCWGKNNYGQLGDGNYTDRAIPTDVVGFGSGVAAVVAGETHTCALMATGGVKCWGSNIHSQLGIGSPGSYENTPTNVAGLSSGVKAITAGGLHTCALLNAGGVMCWGSNTYGQLGRIGGDFTTPGFVTGLSSGVGMISAGDLHTCGVTTTGAAKCWGRNNENQLGDGTQTSRAAPVDVTGLGSGVSIVAAGTSHTCALTTTGAVKCWGSNAYSQLGVSGQAGAGTPVDVMSLSSGVTALSAGKDHNCVLTATNGIKCWGRGLYGQLGNDSMLDQAAPVDITGLTSGVTALEASLSEHTCAVLATSGGVKCWGRNDFGQLGDGSLENRLTPVDVRTDGSVTSTHTPTFTPTATPTATPTNTVTTPPPGSTPTPTVTNMPTATPTTPPSGVGDVYEDDNTCSQARTIPATGAMQEHTFHAAGDTDWTFFAATANTTYRIEVIIPDGSSADISLELYPNCDSQPTEQWNETFTPGVRLDFVAPTTGPIFLRLNNQGATNNNQTRYQLSLRPLPVQPTTGAVIIVAGRLRTNDRLQRNIHNVTNRVYTIFQAQGYPNDDIYYVATDASLRGFDAAATKENLRNAITQWAVERVEPGKPLTLYLMDHGDHNKFYLDGANDHIVTPDELDAWLTTFEQAVPGAKINIIIEACFIGSFIAAPQGISKPGRVVITSSDDNWSAYASLDGAYFSDHFLTSLQQGRNLFSSFSEAQSQINRLLTYQKPWLDANGDNTPNQQEDFAIAAERGFAYAGTLSNDAWPPFIAAATGPMSITDGRGLLSATVHDDKGVDSVWAVVYAPSYIPPVSAQELTSETAPTLLFHAQGNDSYAVEYPAFDETGIYRIVIYAKDRMGNLARPVEMRVEIIVQPCCQLFLPLVAR